MKKIFGLLLVITALTASAETQEQTIVVKSEESKICEDGSTHFKYPYYSAGVESYRFGWGAGVDGAIGICKALGFANYLLGSASGFDWLKFRNLAYLDKNGNFVEIDDRESTYFKDLACYNGEYHNISKSYERKEFPDMVWMKIPNLRRGTEEKRFSVKSSLDGICKILGFVSYVEGSGMSVNYGSPIHLVIVDETGNISGFQTHTKYVNEISCYK